MKLDPMTLSQLVATRISHDLSGPIGAVSNGVELMEEQHEEMQKECMDLVAMSARDAIARVKFFRKAFGVVNDTEHTSWQEIENLTEHMLEGKKIKCHWELAEMQLPNLMAQSILNLILIAADMLIYGGEIIVKHQGKTLELVAKNKTMLQQKIVLSTLKKQEIAAPLDPKLVPVYLLLQLIDRLGQKMTLKTSDEKITMIVSSC